MIRVMQSVDQVFELATYGSVRNRLAVGRRQ